MARHISEKKNEKDGHNFDTSNFEKDHPLYSNKNHRVLGKFKSETGLVPPTEFVGLRAKMYSLDVHQKPKESKMRAKKIKKAYVRKNVRHTHFLNVLRTQKSTSSEFCKFLLTNHVLQTAKVKKSVWMLSMTNAIFWRMGHDTSLRPQRHFSSSCEQVTDCELC